MSLRSHRVIPLCIVAALIGAGGSVGAAMAQTTVPPATPETAPSVELPQDGRLDVEATVASETEPPIPSPSEPSGTSESPTTPAPVTIESLPPVAPTPAVTPVPAPAEATATPPQPAPFVVDVAAALDRMRDWKKVPKADREGLVAAYKAREGRPIWMTAKGATPGAMQLATELSKANDWGLDGSAIEVPALRAAAAESTDLDPNAVADAEVKLSLAVLSYARQARGGRFEPTDLTSYLDRKSPLREPAVVLKEIAGAGVEPDVYLRKLNPQHPQFERLRQHYLAVRGEPAPRKGPSEADRTLANMEQWRWMPDDLGAFHIWVNIPEQLLRVVRDGKVINTERIVVGKANAQTPIFSNEMKHLIFHPFWYLPDSIKTNEILPGLKKGRQILARQNLRLQLNGKDVDPSRFNWSRTDIRRFYVYQPPGRGNALGIVKFMFPNKHAVYMHDTPSKSLFKASVRMFSHGCIRVQDPVKFAELILGEDRGMSPEHVRSLAGPKAPENNQINLTRHIPVHMVYFTMSVDDNGKVSSFKDVYGHEERIRLALQGKMNFIKPVEEPRTPTDPIGRLVEASPADSDFSFGFGDGGRGRGRRSNSATYSGSSPTVNTPRPDWARRVFSDGGSYSGGN